jgi:hypothetical protein
VTDDFSGYKACFELGVTEAGCMAHARRKFHELWANHGSEVGEQALKFFQVLYQDRARGRRLPRRRATTTTAAQVTKGGRRAAPSGCWQQRHKVPDGSATIKAIDYSLKRWAGADALHRRRRLPIDNNWVENQIRPIALGRSNWLFAGSLRAGKRAAAVMSLVHSAKLNGHDPYAYLKDVLERLPTQPASRIEELLPHRWPPPCANPTASSSRPSCACKRNAMAIYQDLVDQHGFAGASTTRSSASVPSCATRSPSSSTACPSCPARRCRWTTARARPPACPAATGTASPACSWPRCATRGQLPVRGLEVQPADLGRAARAGLAPLRRLPAVRGAGQPQGRRLKPDLYEPDLNPVYAATLAHYGVVADPARVRDPNRKGTVEHAIGHTQATALKGRRFESIEAQNEFLEHWEKSWAAKRIHGTERRQVQAMFEEERSPPQTLPLLGMQYFTEAVRTVCDDSCVRVDHSSYAARPAAIGSQGAGAHLRPAHRDPRLQTQALAAHPPRPSARHGGAAHGGAGVQPVARDPPDPAPGQRDRGARQPAVRAAVCHRGPGGPAQAVGHRQPGPALPRALVDSACAQPWSKGSTATSASRPTERLFARGAGGHRDRAQMPRRHELALTQQHPLIRDADEYADLFAHAAPPVPPRARTGEPTNTTPPRTWSSAMNMIEIERALRELRLSGIAETLSTRVMQAQAPRSPSWRPSPPCCRTSSTGAARA